MLVCVYYCAFGTRDRGCSRHPAFPAPSVWRGPTNLQNLGRNLPREREGMLCPHVVPANAGTHTPRQMLFETVVEGFASTSADGVYGSRPAPGRQITPAAHSNISPGSTQNSTRSKRYRQAASACSSKTLHRTTDRRQPRAAGNRDCPSSDSIPALRPISRSREQSG